MIAEFANADRCKVKGRIGLGFKVIKAACNSCKKNVTALKVDEEHYSCPICKGVASPLQGEREFTQSTPYFVLPKDIAALGVFPEKPVSLRVIPAYRELERTIPNSYAKFTSSGTIFCSGDGVSARRYQKANGSKGGYINVPCNSDCPERLNRSCRPSGTFYVILPDVDTFSAYRVNPKSPQSITNIIASLRRLMGREGMISRTICELMIVEKKRRESNSTYYVLELSLPAVSLTELQRLGGRALEDQAPAVNSVDILPPEAQREVGQQGTCEPKDDHDRVRNGRAAVKEKIRKFVDDPYAERALELYACEKFHTDLFADLTVQNLLDLWNSIRKESDVVTRVFFLAKELKYGRVEDLPFGETTQMVKGG
jgi:hypothetical protein